MDWQAGFRDLVTLILFPVVLFMGKVVLDMMKIQAAQKTRNDMLDLQLAERNRTVDDRFVDRAKEIDREFTAQDVKLREHDELFKSGAKTMARVDKNLACVCVKLNIKCEDPGESN